MEALKKIPVSVEDALKILDIVYESCMRGISPASPAVEETVKEYLSKFPSKEEACSAIIAEQTAKCSTSGFLAGLGGFLTLPATLPANIGTVIYWQMRMIACVAHIADFDLKNEATKVFIFSCLAGLSLDDLLIKISPTADGKFFYELICNASQSVLSEIKEAAAQGIVTKYSTKSLVNLGNLIPGIGGVIGSSVDMADTKAIGDRAYRWFFENNI